jgi:cytochrome c biogenesis protein CcmG, thiol:disulfide interchange protein DsbE
VSDVGSPPAAGGPARRPIAAITVAVGIVVAFVFLVLAFAPKGERAINTASPLIGKAPPDVRSTTVDGEPFSIADRRGSWLAINFFATWCNPCITEHPQLVSFVAQQRTRPIAERTEFISIVYQDDDDRVRRFFEERGGGDWTIVRDKDGAFAARFGVALVPETWIIDPAGIVRKRLVSNVTAISLQQEIDQLRAAS